VIAVRATTTPAGHSAPFVNGVVITPDTAAPFISIDSQRHIVPAGMSLQLYVTDWFNSSNNIVWSLVGGPGKVSSTGLYTAPLLVSAATWVTVRARDSVTGLSASYNLYIPAPGQQIPPGTF
jgi:hypothetical protein